MRWCRWPAAPCAARVASPKPQMISDLELLERFGWERADYESAMAFGFPSSVAIRTGLRDGRPYTERLWSATALENWRDRFVSFASKVK